MACARRERADGLWHPTSQWSRVDRTVPRRRYVGDWVCGLSMQKAAFLVRDGPKGNRWYEVVGVMGSSVRMFDLPQACA